MSSYYYDCEFLEGKQDKTFCGVKYGASLPTIDLISIGIVSKDNREYYAISKDFNLKEAWNRYDLKEITCPIEGRKSGRYKKVYWIRENVLKPIFIELYVKENRNELIKLFYPSNSILKELRRIHIMENFTYKNLKRLINKYGKTNKQIAEDIKDFVSYKDTPLLANHFNLNMGSYDDRMDIIKGHYPKYIPEFYGYYSDYDHVALCWLFGKMIDLPTGFPMYTIDLKQEKDRIIKDLKYCNKLSLEDAIFYFENDPDYPKQTNEHNALSDAIWNRDLHNFLNNI